MRMVRNSKLTWNVPSLLLHITEGAPSRMIASQSQVPYLRIDEAAGKGRHITKEKKGFEILITS